MGESAQASDQIQDTVVNLAGKYLTFCLADEHYGIGILKIREIIGMMPITAVPRTAPYVKGVINLRGKVIPVVDLRLCFGMNAIEYNERTCIMVLEIAGRTGDILIGIVVDMVLEVLNISSDVIQEKPEFGARAEANYILGMAKIDGGVKILLDIDRILGAEERDALDTEDQ